MMNKAGGFITLHRQILDWEWYKNINVKVLFLHLLLNANFKDASFEGHKILRGQLVTSLPSLSAELGLSVKQIRGSLEHLISTGEVTSKSFPRYRIITIVRYNEYQDDDSLNGSQTAGERAVKRQSKGRLRAGSGQAEGSQRAAIEQGNKDNKETKEQGNNDSEGTAQRFIPPTRDEVILFCHVNDLVIDVDRFMNHYTSNGWMVGRVKMKDWKSTVRNWALEDAKKSQPVKPEKKVLAQQYEQRDYSSVEAEIAAEQDREMEEFLKQRGGA